ncbi:MAG: hypothetical protein Q8S84_08255 [bacterium]|nr:hypothetical protein [bacterium]MDP3381427.1 hypothetical protein [bacterium]
MSISALGSVKGKILGLNLNFVSSHNNFFITVSSVHFKSQNVTHLPTTSHSN